MAFILDMNALGKAAIPNACTIGPVHRNLAKRKSLIVARIASCRLDFSNAVHAFACDPCVLAQGMC